MLRQIFYCVCSSDRLQKHFMLTYIALHYFGRYLINNVISKIHFISFIQNPLYYNGNRKFKEQTVLKGSDVLIPDLFSHK